MLCADGIKCGQNNKYCDPLDVNNMLIKMNGFITREAYIANKGFANIKIDVDVKTLENFGYNLTETMIIANGEKEIDFTKFI